MESAGSCWQEAPLGGPNGPPPRGSPRPPSAVLVLPDSGPDPPSVRCLQEACAGLGGTVRTLRRGSLELGGAGGLEDFYNADVAILEVNDSLCQPSLFYHLGVRESYSMTNNILLCCQPDLADLKALREDICQKDTDCCGNYTFIPYMVTAQGKVLCCDSPMMKCLTELFQPQHNMESFLTPLTARLTKLLEVAPANPCEYFRETIRRDIRKAREMYGGEQLSQELARIQQRLDSMQCLSLDILMNFLLAYRDVQDYNAIISLVETLQALPTCDVAKGHSVTFHYTFALNRRNGPGDRRKALDVILPVVEGADGAAPDLYCMCGRIYKDMFISSGFKDLDKRDQATLWYGKAFSAEPTLHSGINLAVLQMAAGHQFESSAELRMIGVKLSCLLGRKGSLEKMQHYWDVGFYLGAGILANDVSKVSRASEKLYKLKPPIWYTMSVMETFMLYKHFKKPSLDMTTNSGGVPPFSASTDGVSPFITTPDRAPPVLATLAGTAEKQQLFDFWMGFMRESCQPFISTENCLVLILEMTKVFQPTFLIVKDSPGEQSVSLCHVCPSQEKGIPRWTFPASSIRGASISKCDERCCFLYVLHTAQDFQLYFPSQQHCKWFCNVIHTFTAEHELTIGEDSGDGNTDDTPEFDYEIAQNGDRVILGKGTYGVVYAGRDLNSQVRIAIKEIPERDSRFSQPLHEEIALHKRLKHRNIVRYLGSISQDGFIKIFMEEVPGGSLSSLLRSKWGPLKDNEATIAFYTKQILEGLRYLHDNQIIHRDIKGDNVLINTYSGVLKISDFGTSKRLAGISPSTETFAGTLQYMAPEIIDKGPRGYAKPADIWSLGCTIIEMATGKPPFYELGSPQAAMFKVGMFKIHPEVPESMSEEAKFFILKCFEPDPATRATAAALLQDPFLSGSGKKKSRRPAVRVTIEKASAGEYYRSLSVPASPREEGMRAGENQDRTGSLRTGRSSTDLTQNGTSPVLSFESSQQSFLSTPTDLGTDLTSSASSEESSGMFLLKKESERRATLHRILSEDLSTIVRSLVESQNQSSDATRLSWDHATQLVRLLNTYTGSPDRRQLAQDLLQLRARLHSDGLTLANTQGMLFNFQEAVKLVLRKHHIKPHWVFALDNLICQAVQAALTVMVTELKVQLQSSMEKDPKEQSESEVEDEQEEEEQKEEIPSKGVVVNQERGHLAAAQGTRAPSSGLGTLSLPTSEDSTLSSSPLVTQLSHLRAESNRLLVELCKKEKRHLELLQQALHTAENSLQALRRKSGPLDISESSPMKSHRMDAADPALISWLQSLGVNDRSIEMVLHHRFTLQDLLTSVTRSDLQYTGIRGGMICRIWGAVTEYRQSQNKPSVPPRSDHILTSQEEIVDKQTEERT
ncbi:mitogen-activated protein kinase kinase kinase 6 [Ambystoma mexicanum]|uniref:mitogen-activated protein kinase kinase kinase 6 n=1 Tax=Ambystoma mexicanum TaxID=8296 RepID=UPI0037E943E6